MPPIASNSAFDGTNSRDIRQLLRTTAPTPETFGNFCGPRSQLPRHSAISADHGARFLTPVKRMLSGCNYTCRTRGAGAARCRPPAGSRAARVACSTKRMGIPRESNYAVSATPIRANRVHLLCKKYLEISRQLFENQGNYLKRTYES